MDSRFVLGLVTFGAFCDGVGFALSATADNVAASAFFVGVALIQIASACVWMGESVRPSEPRRGA